MTRPFRFGVVLATATGRQDWLDKCRAAEQQGYDVIAVPDHLGTLAPFSALVAAATVTERASLTAFVVNSAFYQPAVVAREAMTAALLTDGRLELGLGTGYVRAEFDTARVPWGSAGERVTRLADTVTELRRLQDGPRPLGWSTKPPAPPVLIGGHGDRVLTLAARHADTVAFTGAVMPRGDAGANLRLVDADAMAERIAFFEAAAGERLDKIERNILVQSVVVTTNRADAAEAVCRRAPYLSPAQALDVPTLLIGTVSEMADALVARRGRYGISSVFVHESSMTQFADIIEELHGQ